MLMIVDYQLYSTSFDYNKNENYNFLCLLIKRLLKFKQHKKTTFFDYYRHHHYQQLVLERLNCNLHIATSLRRISFN
jgi:hypothetical protein